MPEVGGIIVPEAAPGALPNPRDPRVAQQYLMTALWRMATAAGGTIVFETKDVMDTIPLSLTFVTAPDGTKAAVIQAQPVEKSAIVQADPGILGQLEKAIRR